MMTSTSWMEAYLGLSLLFGGAIFWTDYKLGRAKPGSRRLGAFGLVMGFTWPLWLVFFVAVLVVALLTDVDAEEVSAAVGQPASGADDSGDSYDGV